MDTVYENCSHAQDISAFDVSIFQYFVHYCLECRMLQFVTTTCFLSLLCGSVVIHVVRLLPRSNNKG